MEHPEVWTGPEELRMIGHFRGEDNSMTVKISHTDIHRRFYFSAAHPQTLKNWVKHMEDIHDRSAFRSFCFLVTSPFCSTY